MNGVGEVSHTAENSEHLPSHLPQELGSTGGAGLTVNTKVFTVSRFG